MKIIVTGATGFIGTRLCKELIERKNDLIIFSRDKNAAKQSIAGAKNYIEWDFNIIESWRNYLDGSDAVIHFSGANIFGSRWNGNYKKQILKSREISTRNLVEAIGSLSNKPECFICSSAVGYYGNKGDEILSEESSPGNDFLSVVCRAWENEAQKVESFGVRRISMRTGIVLSKEGGALKRMLTPFKFFAGGSIGSGKQWFPWIHIDDIVKAFLFALENKSLHGAVNAAASNPVTMKEFAAELGKALSRPSIFFVPEFAIKLVLGESSEAILASQRVLPKKLLENGFKFNFENIDSALKNIFKK